MPSFACYQWVRKVDDGWTSSGIRSRISADAGVETIGRLRAGGCVEMGKMVDHTKERGDGRASG